MRSVGSQKGASHSLVLIVPSFWQVLCSAAPCFRQWGQSHKGTVPDVYVFFTDD